VSQQNVVPVYEAVVVGAGGFLGSAVMRAFLAAGIDATGYTLERPLFVDGRLDADARGARTVVWCASRINPRLAAEEPALIAADVADLDEAIAEFRSWETPPRIVTFSSGGTVYGPPSEPPFAESDDTHPVNAYGEAKLMLEEHLRASGLDAIALRVANAYGPGQRPAPGQGVLAHWMEAILAGEEVQLYGDPDATRDYVFVDDIARAAVAAHAAPTCPAILNVGSGQATTLDDLLTALEPVVRPHVLRVARHPARATDTAHSTLDISLAAEAVGWQPQVSLADGVALQWKWRTAT